MRAIAGQLEPLPVDHALFQARPDQSAVVRNTVERAELVRAHVVTRGKMTAEMLEPFAAARTQDALAIEPCIDFRDRMKLTGIDGCLSFFL